MSGSYLGKILYKSQDTRMQEPLLEFHLECNDMANFWRQYIPVQS